MFLLLLFASLACQAVTGLISPSPTSIPPTDTSTPSPSPLPPPFTLTPTLTPSPVPVSPTPAATLTLAVTPSAVQRKIFNELWQIVDEEYLYADFNGLDWDAVYTEYYRRVEDGMTDMDFYAAMDEMIAHLGDDHSVFLSPEEAAQEDSEMAGENDYVGIGVLTTSVPQRQRVTVVVVFPDSPAERAGLKPHDSILAVDGQPIMDDQGIRRDLLDGPENTSLTLTVQTPGETSRQVHLLRERVKGAVPVPAQVLLSPGGIRAGYLILPTFGDETIDDQVEEGLQRLGQDEPLDGLILDNRQNPGGSDTVLRNMLAHFTSGNLGEFVNRRQRGRDLIVAGQDVNGSLTIPLVVLIGKDTASFAEIFSGILKNVGRAYLIGERTDGNIEILWGYDFEDGSRAWIAHDTFRPSPNPEMDWETSGIIPDLTVDTDWDQVTLETDPTIAAALQYLEQQIAE